MHWESTEKRGLRLINFHPRKVIKQQKDIVDFYEKQSMPLLPNLECCNISFALEADLKCEFQCLSSQSDLSDFNLEEMNQIDNLYVSTISDSLFDESEEQRRQEQYLENCPVSVVTVQSYINLPTLLQTEEQKIVSEGLTKLLEGCELKVNIFLKELYNKMSTMYENYLGTGEGKRSDSKNWTGYYSALYKFTNSNEYTGLVENCIQKVEKNHLLIFSKLFDAVSQFILEKKVSQVTPVSTQSKTFAIDSAGLGRLRYLSGMCVAKSKHHYIKLGQTNMYKKDKSVFVCNCFLKVKM